MYWNDKLINSYKERQHLFVNITISQLVSFFNVCYRITKHLGSGQFGTVNEGVWRSPTGDVGVAIKMLPRDCIEEEKVKLLQEAAIMGQFSHPNVVKLHGVVTVGEPVSSFTYKTLYPIKNPNQYMYYSTHALESLETMDHFYKFKY